MLVPIQLQFNIEIQNDAELVHKANGVGAAKIVVNRFLLWVPRLTPKDSLYDKSSFLKETRWTYLREMYASSAPTRSSGFFQISSSGTQLNLANYNSLYPLIYFDLTYQTEKVTRDPKQLTFRYQLNQNANADLSVHAIVLYEEEVKIDKIGNECKVFN